MLHKNYLIRGSCMTNFELHKYPYEYKCDRCSRTFELSEKKERSLKDEYGISAGSPLFFACLKCGSGLSKPVGYSGAESMIVVQLGFWDIIKALFKKK